MKRPKIEIYPDESGEYRWRLKGGNGEIQATGEGHTSRRDAIRAAKAARRNMLIAKIEVE